MDDLRDLVERFARTTDPQYFAADATFQDVARGEAFAGQAAIGTMLRSLLYDAFSGVEIDVRTVVVDESRGRAAVEWIFRGRHTGDLWGHPLTGRRIELPMLAVYEIQDGSIRTARLYYDTATLLSQLGHAPERTPQGAGAARRVDPAARARRWIASLAPRWRRARELRGVVVAALFRGIREGAQRLPHPAPLVPRLRLAGLRPQWRRPRGLRRVTVAALVGALVVAVLVGQAILAPVPAAAAEASLTILDGDVGVSRAAGGFVSATDGQAVRSGDTVRTGDGAHAVLTYFDGSTATIEPLSEVVVEEISISRSGELIVGIRQTIGHTWHVVTRSRSGQSNYQVRTPSASAVVRGTAFEVKVKPKAGSPEQVVTEVATTDGEVGVTSPSAPEIEVKVPEGTKTDVEPQARPNEPAVIPEPDVKVKVTLDAVLNAIVVQQNGLAVGVQQGQAVRYAPGSKVKVENGKLVLEIPNAQVGRLSSIVQGSSTDTGSVHIETEISSGALVVARTVEDRPLERSEDPARSGSVAKGGLILTPVGVVVLPDDEAKKAADANIGKAPLPPPAPAGLVPNVIPPAEQRPAIIVPGSAPPPPAAGATTTAPPQPATAPFAGAFQAFLLTGIAPGTPTGSPIPGTSADPARAPAAIPLDALPPQVLSVLFASNPGHLAKPAQSIESAAPATVPPAFGPPGQIGTAPPTAPGVFCDARGQPAGCIPFTGGPSPVPPQGAPVFCDQRGQPPGCIPPQTTAYLPGGIFAAGGLFGVGGLFDPNAGRGPQAPGATAPPRALFTAPPAQVHDGTCGLAGFRSCVAGETPRPGLVPFGAVAPAIGCGIPGDARCSSGTPIQGITCDFAGGPACPINAAPPPPGVSAVPGATAFPGGFAPPQGAFVFCDQRGQPAGCIPAGGAFVPGASAVPFFDGTCGLAGLRPCFPGETTRPGVVAPQLTGDGNCGLPGLRGCFASETPRPGLVGSPTAAPGTFPGITGPTRGITCDGPALPTCPPNAVDPPPGLVPGRPFPGGPGAPTQPAAGIPFDAVCGQPGFRACLPGETPQHVIGVTCGTANLPSCPAEAKPGIGPGFVAPAPGAQQPGAFDGTCGLPGLRPCQAGETSRPGLAVPGFGPGGQQPATPSASIAPAIGCGIPGDPRCSSGTPIQGITCGFAGGPTCPSNALPPGSTAPPSAIPGFDGNCGGPGLRGCFAGETPRPGLAAPSLPPGGVYCDNLGRPSGCIPQTGARPPASGAPVYCDQRGQPPGCIAPGATFVPPGASLVPGTAAPGFDGTCGPGYRPCFAGETPRPGLAAPPSAPIYCDFRGLPAGCVPTPTAPGGAAPPTGAPGVYCDFRGQPPGCIPQTTPFPGAPSAQPVAPYCDNLGRPPGCIPPPTGVPYVPPPAGSPLPPQPAPGSFAPQPTPSLFTPAPGVVYCPPFGFQPAGCVPPPFAPVPPPSGAPVYCDQNGQPPGCISSGQTFVPSPSQAAPVLPYCDGVIITTNCRPSPFTPPPAATTPPPSPTR